MLKKVFTHPVFIKATLLTLQVLSSLAMIAIVLMSAMAFAQGAAPVPAPGATQPDWLTLLLKLGPYLIGAILLFHPMLKLGALLHANAQHRMGLAAALEDKAGSIADALDAYLTNNQQSLKDLLDPAKRAAAEAHLAEQGKAVVAAAAGSAAAKNPGPTVNS